MPPLDASVIWREVVQREQTRGLLLTRCPRSEEQQHDCRQPHLRVAKLHSAGQLLRGTGGELLNLRRCVTATAAPARLAPTEPRTSNSADGPLPLSTAGLRGAPMPVLDKHSGTATEKNAPASLTHFGWPTRLTPHPSAPAPADSNQSHHQRKAASRVRAGGRSLAPSPPRPRQPRLQCRAARRWTRRRPVPLPVLEVHCTVCSYTLLYKSSIS